MATYHKYVNVSVDSGKETVVSGMLSTQNEPKHILYIIPGTIADNIDLLVYIEREKRADFPVDLLDTTYRKLDLDIDLPVGQTLYVGFRNKTASSIQADIGIAYTIGK